MRTKGEILMKEYETIINKIYTILNSFCKSGRIIEEKVKEVFQEAHSTILKNETKLLNNQMILIKEKRLFFGALNNLDNVIQKMQFTLINASKMHENPITAYQCKELLPYMSNLAQEIDTLGEKYHEHKVYKIFDLSRVLRKRAANVNLYPTLMEEIEQINLQGGEISEFVEEFNNRLQSEIDLA